MNLDDAKRRFIEEIKLRAFDDRFVDKAEEMEILKVAISQGVVLDSARSALRQVCDKLDYVLESVLDEKAKEMLEQFAQDGQVDKKEFDDTVAVLTRAANGKLSTSQLAQKAKSIMVAGGMKPRQGLFKGGSWFDEV